jgi:hypothetical protein
MARRPLLAGSRRAISTARAVPADPRLADRAVPGVRADRLDPADPGVPETTDRVDPADLQASDQADRVVPACGMAIPSAATSTEPRGATALRPGALARHRGRTGVGRFRHPVGSG